MLGWFFAARAFIAEFAMLAGAIACVLAGVVLLSIRVAPALLEKWTGLEALKRTLAHILFGVAVGLACWFGGHRQAAALCRDAALRNEIAGMQKLAAERDRRDDAFAAARIDAAMRANRAAAELAALQEQKRKDDDASHSRDRAPCLDAGGVRRLDAIR